MNNNIQLARLIAIDSLSNFAKNNDFWEDFELAFGRNYNKSISLNIKNNLAAKTFKIPEIVLVDTQILGNANAAFAAHNNTIYISKSFASNDVKRLAATLIEEIGHSIDAQINTQDSTGDEGQIFSALVRGETLNPNQLAGLKAENDRAVINVGGQQLAIEQAGSIDYRVPLEKSILFYKAQRSGDLEALNDGKVAWRGDSAMNDGKGLYPNNPNFDLVGGYYDAGDHVKFGFPMASAMTMLGWGVIEYRSAYEQSGQLDEVMNAIKWGTDYILKAHVVENGQTKEFWGQVGDLTLDHAAWVSPENMTMDRPASKIDALNPGSDLAGESAAALAAASILFRPTDPTYARILLDNAKQLYRFAKDSDPNRAGKQQGKYSDSITTVRQNLPNEDAYKSSGYEDELGWSAIWLHKAIKAAGFVDDSYLADAQIYYSIYRQLTSPDGTWTQTWDDKSYGGMVLMAQELPSISHYRTEVEKWLAEWTTNNTDGSVKYTPGGLAWLNEWGSLRYTANTAFIAGVYADTVNDPNQKYSNFAQSQIEYILGKNPTGISYMVGFGDKYPERVHHRAASGFIGYGDNPPQGNDPGGANQNLDNRYDIVGGLVGGPTAPTDNSYIDARLGNDANNQPLYKGNEVALDYNAGFTGALARLYGINNPTPNITLAVSSATVTEDGATNLVYTFTRTGNTINALTVNYSVSGTASLSTDYTQTGATTFAATAGTVTFAAGATTATVTVDPTIDTTIETNETVVLTLTSSTLYSVSTTTAVTGTILNDDVTLPTVTLAVAPASVNEDGITNLIYTFTRTGVNTNSLTVNYGVGGTATLNTDYTQNGAATFAATNGTVTFAAGATTATVTVNPTIDRTIETNETVILTLTNGTGYNIGNNSNSLVLLSDNFDTENNRNGADNYSSLTNWNVTDGSIDVIGTGYKQDLLPNNGLYLDLDGTIIGGGNGGRIESKPNFSFVAGDFVTLKFSLAGSQRGDTNSVNVSLGSLFNETFTRDSAKPFEQITRSFTVNSSTSGKLIFDHAGGDNLGLLLDRVELSKTINGVIGTIVNDDDISPAIAISDTTIVEGINGNPTQALITVSLNKASSQAIAVNYATSNVTAISGTDYTATTGILTFAAGEISKTIAVPILNDNLNEANETFNITLSTPTNAMIADSQATITITDTLLSNVTTILPALVENLTLTGTAAMNATGNAGNNVLTGNSANNSYIFDADLAQGQDTINETSTGGIDTLNLSQTAAAVNINLGLTTAQTVNANLKLVIPVITLENFIGGSGNDRITGNGLDNNLNGGSGDDRIFAGGGNDILVGGGGNDVISGGSGNDIFAYSGLLSGATTATGLFGVDSINDFTTTQDKISLSKATFSAITSAAGTAIGANFITVDDDSLVEAQSAAIVYSLSSGGLFYNQNGVAAGFGTNGGEFANILGSAPLVGSDFTIVA